MKVIVYILFSILPLSLFSQKEYLVIDTMIIGNYDSIQGKDTAFLMVANNASEMFGCKICDAEIRFSNQTEVIPFISDVGGPFENLGDLNGDGIDEIAHTRTWYMGCRGVYQIFQNVKGVWIEIGYMSYHACGDKRGIRDRVNYKGNGKLILEGGTPHGEKIFKTVEMK